MRGFLVLLLCWLPLLGDHVYERRVAKINGDQITLMDGTAWNWLRSDKEKGLISDWSAGTVVDLIFDDDCSVYLVNNHSRFRYFAKIEIDTNSFNFFPRVVLIDQMKGYGDGINFLTLSDGSIYRDQFVFAKENVADWKAGDAISVIEMDDLFGKPYVNLINLNLAKECKPAILTNYSVIKVEDRWRYSEYSNTPFPIRNGLEKFCEN